ncbi:quinon protein alcohol dehydrogenase-like superfamily [Lentinula aff. detonsa]|uniref:Elongator complex protein 2 n=1 Tax=Lentinula aff. detonsa TaxID=2804958 RepID=A0AA38K9Z0_9AGAR|nr:quinon protein alcohol dehydrogenase-like superfamily [Lentinula aff. detonsa]
MNVSTAYISASTNRYSGASDVTYEGTVIFGSSNLIGLWDVSDDDEGISEMIPGHDGVVTCIRVMNSQSFASADDKGEVRIWRRPGSTSQWTSFANFTAHKQAISALCVTDEYLVTGSSDATVKLWKLPQDDSVVQIFQTISLSGRYPLSLACARLPQSNSLVLAIGGTDRNIQLWTRSETMFVQAAVLGGHEDWIRGLSFSSPEADGPLVLASGSQDATIRLWNIEVFKKGAKSQASESLSDDLLDAFEESLGDFGDTEEGGRQISLKRHILSVKYKQENSLFSVTFDALLVGHEAGITSISWRASNANSPTPTLLSTSVDSSLILWSTATVNTESEDRTSSIWINRQRFGDIGGQRLGGFVGGVWRPDGDEVLAWGWSGGWRRWRCESHATDDDEVWEEAGAIGGHRGSVKSVDWSPSGTFLISSGIDQTTRIHGAVPRTDKPATWYELARPQMHGYDLLGTVFLEELKFASIADEKVLRIFEAPLRFMELMETLHVSQFSENERNRPMGATVPPLYLSNKADEDGEVTIAAPEMRRPFDGELSSVTLWPEVEKIFGHGYESITLATSNSGRYIASACKASSPEHAVVRIYDTTTWQPVGEPLAGHSLTVTQIAFSPDNRLILTVSRDRSWRLYQRAEEGYRFLVHESKPHGRIIWDCAWAPEGDIFATASRDKTVKIWGKDDGDNWRCVFTLKTEESATAVHFTAFDSQQKRYLAVGLENGKILIYSSVKSDTSWTSKMAITSDFGHVSQINRLRWRPGTGEQFREIASCSEDGTLKILIVQIV